MKTNHTTALITPSWLPDIDRCAQLLKTAERFTSGFEGHYVLVDAQDEAAFRNILGQQATIIVKETLLPSWLHQSSLSRKWWWSLRALPVRGWILQQITKLAVTQTLDVDACCFVDSDTRFVRPFAAESLWEGDALRFFRDDRKPHFYDSKRYRNWYGFAANQFSLGDEQNLDGSYIAQLTTMRRDSVADMIQMIEQKHDKEWVDVLLRSFDFSEFILYGVFVDNYAAENSHLRDPVGLCHSSWFYDISTQSDVGDFVMAMGPNHVAVHLQSNLKMDSAALAQALGE